MKDLWVVVTRPADQAESLCSALEERGGHVIRWPAIAIEPIELSRETIHYIKQLKSYDHVIFISVNAASYGISALRRYDQELKGLNVYAVGKSTARALMQAGIDKIKVPKIASSKGLLAMPEFDVDVLKGKKCLIFRGIGGNEKLAEGLSAREAEVDYAEVYRRQVADSDPEVLVTHWENAQLDLIIVTSIAGLDNLFVILGEKNRQHLLSTPLLTVSERVADYAKQKGFHRQILIAESAGDRDIIATMQSWHRMREKE